MVSNYELSRGLQEIIGRLQVLEAKIDIIPSIMSKALIAEIKALSFKAVDLMPSLITLSIAEHRTLEVLKGLREPVTADEVALITHRARAVESMYLNGLHRRGMVLKERRGRKAFFILKEEYHAKG